MNTPMWVVLAVSLVGIAVLVWLAYDHDRRGR